MAKQEGVELLECELEALLAKKEMYYSKIQRLYDYVPQLDDANTLRLFKAEHHTLDTAIKSYSEVIDQVNTLSRKINPKYKFNYTAVDSAEQLYGYIREAYLNKVDTLAGSKPSVAVKLPKIDLIEFSGDKRQWPLFIETFNSLVHHNSSLDNTSKVHYLLSCLKGPAQALCASVLPTSSNYNILLRTLKDRYEDKRSLANTYLAQLLDFKPAQTESLSCLSAFLDKFDTAVNALKNLNLTDLLDYILVYLGLSKIDAQTHKYFEMGRSSANMPTYSELIEFIKAQIKSLNNSTKPGGSNKSFHRNKNATHTYIANNCETRNKCIVCNQDHLIYNCSKFIKLNPFDRFKLAKSKKLCLVCLAGFHKGITCSGSSCRYCEKPHHYLLHFNNSSNDNNIETTTVQVNSQGNEISTAGHVSHVISNVCSSVMSKNSLTTLLSTAIVNVCSSIHIPIQARFLVDTASQSHFVTTSLCRKLGLEVFSRKLTVLGIGGRSQPIKGSVDISISSRINPDIRFDISAFVVDKITEKLPSVQVKINALGYLKGVALADHSFWTPGSIDGILGADLFPHILGTGRIMGGVGLPVGVETSFGYVVMGNAPTIESSDHVSQTFCSFPATSALETVLQKFWEVEQIGVSVARSPEDEACEEIFKSTTVRDSRGRYAVSLPFIKEMHSLGNSLDIALRRFLLLEKRLTSNSQLKEKYFDAFQDYVNQDHVTYCGNLESSSDNGGYFVPHFPVLKDSISTPLRIVFDSSSKTSNLISLNDCLYSGEKLQTDILKILLNFRLFKIAMVADVRQMYRNILLQEEHRKYQKVLWRFSPDDPFSVYELTRVSFGLKSAPFLALRTIQQLVLDEESRFPLAASCVARDLYVDDVVSSVPSIEHAKTLFSQLVGLFNAGGFALVKWSSNSHELLRYIPKSLRLDRDVCFEEADSTVSFTKVLGLEWHPNLDIFSFTVHIPDDVVCSKRRILGTIARIWDPLGFLSPLVLTAKLMMRELWLCKIDWDDIPPDSIANRWCKFVAELSQLRDIQVPRHIGIVAHSQVSLFGFSDASQKGLGAMVYVRVVSGNEITVRLLCAKSKVAPIKTISIARLELCGALLLARLLHYIVDCYSRELNVVEIFASTDSTVVLSWIKGSPHQWKTFVANRISKIQSLISNDCWFHIVGKDNPADCLSRGLSPAELANHSTWFDGPPWLLENSVEWPLRKLHSIHSCDERELVALPALVLDDDPIDALMARSSSWMKLLRIVVHILRFCKVIPTSPVMDATALRLAERVVIKSVQKAFFSIELQQLSDNKICSRPIRQLAPFLDKDGLIRVGGRLGKAALEFDQQHPYLLPKHSHLVDILIFHIHEKNFHTGPKLLLSLLRQKYWILSARSLVRKCVRQCNYCFKFKPKAIPPFMADLPKIRIAEAKPFLHTGVDYGGPFHVTISKRRGVKTQKTYICLFVCLVTKALHLELATSLSTEAFINCFKRFLARRGSCTVLYSDCGTNFVGAKAELDEIFRFIKSQEYETTLISELASRGIDWRFNPPRAPHFGGIWEANIKAVKTHLAKAIGNQILSYEEFLTVLTQIEALLNTRPLCWLSSNPSDPSALTPSHFLTLSPLETLPALDLSNDKPNIIVRKTLLDTIVQSYWKRWRLTYLHELQTRQKWNTKSNPAREGMLVLVQQDNIPPLNWPIGIIDKLFPGSDGVSRVAIIRTKSGSYKRPVVKLCPLPTQ